jgi:hypothetical protein
MRGVPDPQMAMLTTLSTETWSGKPSDPAHPGGGRRRARRRARGHVRNRRAPERPPGAAIEGDGAHGVVLHPLGTRSASG